MSDTEADPLEGHHSASTSRDKQLCTEDSIIDVEDYALWEDFLTRAGRPAMAAHFHASRCWGSNKEDLWNNEKHMGILYDKLPLMKKTLLASTQILCDHLKPDDILRSMKSKGALTQDDVTIIKQQATATEQVDKLIEVLLRKPLSAYNTFMDILQEERPDLHSEIITIEKKQSLKRKRDEEEKTISFKLPRISLFGSSFTNTLSDPDIEDIVNLLKPHELKRLYKELSITSTDTEEAIKENIDPKDEARLVLTYFRQINGSKATRQKIIDALKANKLTQYAADQLEQMWNVKYHATAMEDRGHFDTCASTSYNQDSPKCKKPKCSYT